MKLTKKQTLNQFNVVGKILSMDVRSLDAKPGKQDAISGNMTVESASGDKYNISFYQSPKWKFGQPDEKENPNYGFILSAQQRLAMNEQATAAGQEAENIMVSVQGELSENRFASNNGEVISVQELRGSFFEAPRTGSRGETAPHGTFDIVGVVGSRPRVINSAEGEPRFYQLTILQGQYSIDAGFRSIDLAIELANNAALEYITDNMPVGSTQHFKGRVQSNIITEERVIEAGFGQNSVQVFQKNETIRFIDAGGYDIAEIDMYTEEQIATLTKNRETRESNILASRNTSASTTSGASSFGEGAKPASSGLGLGGTDTASGLLGLK